MSVELVGTTGTSHMVLRRITRRDWCGPTGETTNENVDGNHVCLISQVDDQLVVWDLGGKGGTFVNGSRVKRATLRDSDTLRFGPNEFRVRSEQPPDRYMHGVRS